MNKVVGIFWRFLLLGMVSFGGPAAHIGYFQKTFVQRLHWLDQTSYAKLIALSQFLPGPGSSQIGFALGYRQAGLGGAIAAFVGFTLPSFLLLYLLATSLGVTAHDELITAIVKGFKLLAVVVVADAVITMFKSFCQSSLTIFVAAFSAIVLTFLPSLLTQMAVLLIAAAIGSYVAYAKRAEQMHSNDENSSKAIAQTPSAQFSRLPFVIFVALFIGLPLVASHSAWLQLFSDFYTSGSLVFGGGHVVLPLLQQTIGDSVTTDQFLTGYAAAQAVPGPMFTLASFLGATVMVEHSFYGALLATLAIFLPGFLLILALQGSWDHWASKAKVAGAVSAINAAVVGLLLAALYQPVAISAITSMVDVVLVGIALAILRFTKLHIIFFVVAFALLGLVL
ncbi:chromate efflux transporter [Colwelliaceae bacterium BS250]